MVTICPVPPEWLAASLAHAHRCTNRDTKIGVLLQKGGDQHRLANVWYLHTLALTLACAEWWPTLVGLQVYMTGSAPDPPHDVNQRRLPSLT